MKFDFRNFPGGSRIEVEQQPNKTVRLTYKPPAESSAEPSELTDEQVIRGGEAFFEARRTAMEGDTDADQEAALYIYRAMTGTTREHTPPSGNDWVLAIAHALGLNRGFNVPIVPSVEEFRKLFAAVRASTPTTAAPADLPSVAGTLIECGLSHGYFKVRWQEATKWEINHLAARWCNGWWMADVPGGGTTKCEKREEAEAVCEAWSATSAVPTDLTDTLEWLASHCRAIGMVKKSDSGLTAHDIALFTYDLNARAEKAEAATSAALPDVTYALRLILPMAKGYAMDHPVGSNAAYISQAEAALAASAAPEAE